MALPSKPVSFLVEIHCKSVFSIQTWTIIRTDFLNIVASKFQYVMQSLLLSMSSLEQFKKLFFHKPFSGLKVQTI